MKRQLLFLASATMAVAAVAAGAAAQTSAPATADSVQPGSSVSLAVEPALSDGRLVLKIAAKNSGAAPVQFGPSSVQISRPSGEAIGLYPLQALVNDVRMAAGLEYQEPAGGRATEGAYSAPQLGVRDGRVDPTGYTGGARIGQEELLRRLPRRSTEPTISKEEAEKQIAVLKSGILQDTTVAPGQIAAGQLVTQKLDFKKGEDRTLHVRVRIGGDEHGFTIAAPNN